MAQRSCEGYIGYVKGLLNASDMKRGSPEYEDHDKQIRRETLRGIAYILERLNEMTEVEPKQ